MCASALAPASLVTGSSPPSILQPGAGWTSWFECLGRAHDRPGAGGSATRSECRLRSASGGPDALDGGVTRFLSLDAHGKTPGMQLLDLELEKG
jgi:hypothetical protein